MGSAADRAEIQPEMIMRLGASATGCPEHRAYHKASSSSVGRSDVSERELLLPSDGERRRGEDRKDRIGPNWKMAFMICCRMLHLGRARACRERAPSTERRTGDALSKIDISCLAKRAHRRTVHSKVRGSIGNA